MKTTVSNHIYIEDPIWEVVKWAKDNLTIANPDYFKTVNAGRWSGNIPKYYKMYEFVGDDLIMPFGVLKRLWPLLKHGEVKTDFRDLRKHSMSGSIKLYDYQEEAVLAMEKAKNGILVAPCGSGKTQMGIELINRIGGRALWLTHTRDLLNQSMNRAKSYFDGDFGTITEGQVNIGKDITFATVQTMVKIDLLKYRDMWDVVVIDEAHKVAGTPTKLMMFYRVITHLNARYKYGLSATMHRADNLTQSTYNVIGDKIFEITEEMVGDKILKAKHEMIESQLPESIEYLESNGMINFQALINYITFDDNRNQLIANLIKNEPDKFFLVLGHRVEHTNILRDLVGEGEVLNGHVLKEVRDRILQETREGKNRVIYATYNLAKEGLDVPNFDRLIMASPQKDYTIVKQSVGRIERNIDGKGRPIIYDVVDSDIGICIKWYKKRQTILKK
jgi:superfamily II DNA or RNA helicase